MPDVPSVVNLAKAQLLALDKTKTHTTVSTPTYELLLMTLVELGSPSPAAQTAAKAQARFVSEHLAEVASVAAAEAKRLAEEAKRAAT